MRSQQSRRHRPDNLGWLLAASTVSNLADGAARVAFPLLAADVTRDPVLIAGLAATQFLPWLLFGIMAGTLLDRVNRRTAIITANAARAVALGILTGMIATGTVDIVVVYTAALMMGTAETVADSATNVLIPTVTEGDRLERANSRLQATEIIGETFLGGPIGSLTYAAVAVFPFLLDTVGFAVAAVLLAGLAGSFRPQTRTAQPTTNTTRQLRGELADGLRWLRSNSLITRMVILAGTISLTSELAQAQLVLYALQDLGLSEAAFGVFSLAGGLGGLLSATLASRMIHHLNRMTVLLLGIVTAGAGFIGMGMTSEAALAAPLFGLFAAGVVPVNVVLATVRHSVIPDDLLGRVLGMWRTAVWGTIPAGALLGGVLTESLGTPSATFRVSGALLMCTAVVGWLLLRGQRHSIEVAGRSHSTSID